MAGMSDYLEQNALDWFFRRQTWDPGDPKVKLYSTGPTDVDAGTGTELSGATNYTAGGNSAARGSTNWQVVTSTNGMALQNKATAAFSWTAGNDWPAVTGAALTTSTGTFMWGNTMTTRDGGNGDTLRFAAGAIDLKIDATTSAGISTYSKTQILNHIGIADQSTSGRVPATAYVACYTSATALNLMTGASGTEVSTSGTNYSRQSVTSSTFWHAAASVGTGYHIHNVLLNTFSAAGTAWGTVRYIALVDQGSGTPNYWYACCQLSGDIQIDAGDTFSIAADAWKISLDESN